MRIDYLIIGQGLAGSILAEHCLMAGLSIKVVSEVNASSSSMVAGGLYNPVTGRKMVKTWNADNLFNYLTPFYQNLESQLKEQFLNEIPIYRPFLDFEAQNEWMGKSSEGSFDNFVQEVYTGSAFDELQDHYGGILLKNSGYLDTRHFVTVYHEKLRKKKLLIEEHFDHSLVEHSEDGIVYKGIKAKALLFCEGTAVRDNPFFNWLPFRPVKGEILTIETSHIPRVIYNRGVFVIGKKNARCTVGATYDHNDLSLDATEKAKNELKEKLKKLINFDFKVVEHRVGIRPATKDRRPIIGVHPTLKHMYIFNGLGAKGVSLAPFYAKQLVDHLTAGAKLDNEINIERYFSLF